ncbi:hypothetical protein CLJ1_2588 [Pseudomonas paraeruginosa]|nr:hypothetical protein CLJ1_2588 [Pseudomonas aeruginosa]
MVGGGAGLGVDPGKNAEARGRADRRVGIYVPVEDALAGEPVQGRRPGQWIAVGADERAVVLAHQPQDVGPGLPATRRGQGNTGQGRRQEHGAPLEKSTAVDLRHVFRLGPGAAKAAA